MENGEGKNSDLSEYLSKRDKENTRVRVDSKNQLWSKLFAINGIVGGSPKRCIKFNFNFCT